MKSIYSKNHIQIMEGHPRGFCSNLLCLFGALYRAWLIGGHVSVYHESLFNLYVDSFSKFKSYKDILESPLLIADSGLHNPVDMGQFLFDTRNAITFKVGQEMFSSLISFNSLLLEEANKVSLNKPYASWNHSLHRRCTDHSMHEFIQPRKVFFDYIRTNIPGDEYFYLATDSQAELEGFLAEFGERVLYNVVERSSSGEPIHLSSPRNHKSREKMSDLKNKRMIEVVSDILRIASSTTVLCTNSGIPYTAKLINSELKINDISLPR
ncbi:hypothetical protein KBY58_04385 [Cyanobium sp. HWJ4-Hawea]|uniref:hypothetical protein n=1 Tax=Cyanobium sp. HWJ4-Hawea TaxID=2823713 RepID=UPI0020CDC9EE|nr:hypothetical protein [Cyanobium sp. HWJ4-Hawea]MCP9808667.1 hypothetical protein [Cyanobium sp. HWJ4-Hawea]